MIEQLLLQFNPTIGLVVLLISLLSWSYYKSIGTPPGPWGLPFVGYLPFLGTKVSAEITLHELAKKYGQVMSLKFGPYPSIVLDSFEAIKEAYLKQGDIFSGRPEGNLMKIDEEDTGILITDGEIWKAHRRFALSTLRDYGIGKNSIEPRITEEIHYMLEEMAKEKGKPFDFHLLLGMSTANIVCTLEFGKRFDYADKSFQRIREIQDKIIDLFSSFPIRAFYPKVARLPFLESITHERQILSLNKEFRVFIDKMVDEHKKNYVESSKFDYIDAYFTERNSTIRKTGSEGYFDSDQLRGTLQLLFGAGTETTTSTLRWAILAMLTHPEIQKKVQNEIDEVIGLDRVPTMADKPKMPYTDAVIMEAHRFGTIVPLGVFHSNMEETELLGFRIPKRTMVITNVWAVHFDPKLWDEPKKFKPERFINEKGQAVKPEYLIPFGIGKRLCMGEPLARIELFLYFTSMLQRFTFQPPEGVKPSLEDYEVTAIRRPTSYKAVMIQREGYHAPH